MLPSTDGPRNLGAPWKNSASLDRSNGICIELFRFLGSPVLVMSDCLRGGRRNSQCRNPGHGHGAGAKKRSEMSHIEDLYSTITTVLRSPRFHADDGHEGVEGCLPEVHLGVLDRRTQQA